MKREMKDAKILLFRPRFVTIRQKILIAAIIQGRKKRRAIIINMKNAKAALYKAKKKFSSRHTKQTKHNKC